MTEYDLTRMRDLGKRYRQIRTEGDAVRAELMAEVEKATRAGVRQVDIVEASRLTRERLRQIRIAKEKAVAAQASSAKKTPRKRSNQ